MPLAQKALLNSATRPRQGSMNNSGLARMRLVEPFQA